MAPVLKCSKIDLRENPLEFGSGIRYGFSMTAFTSIRSRMTPSPAPNRPAKRSDRVRSFRFGRRFLPMSLARYAYAPMRALLHAVFRVLDHATTAAADTAILTAYDYGAKKEARRDLPLGRTTSVSSAFSTYVYDPLLAHAPGTGDSVITAFTAYAYRPQYTSTQHAPATTTPHGTHAETDLHFHAYGSLDVCRWPSRDPIGERGGLNEYGFVNNEPIGLQDVLALVS